MPGTLTSSTLHHWSPNPPDPTIRFSGITPVLCLSSSGTSAAWEELSRLQFQLTGRGHESVTEHEAKQAQSGLLQVFRRKFPQSPVMWLSKVLRLNSNYCSSGSWSQSYRSKHKILILDQCFFALRTWWPLHVCVGLLLSRYAAVQAPCCKWADYILLDNSTGLLRKGLRVFCFSPSYMLLGEL